MEKYPQRVHALVAFGDIRGFGSYTQRITDDQTQIIPFLEKYDESVYSFESQHEYFLKHLGDGFLCVSKINGNEGDDTARFLTDLWNVQKEIQHKIRQTKYPRPDGFRIRVAAGLVYQTCRDDGTLDFRGYHINLASKMLQIEKEAHPFLVHESAKQLMTKIEIMRAGFYFNHLPPPELRRYPEGIYKEDMSVLYSMIKK